MYRTHRAGKDVTCHIRPISCSACECGVSSASALRHDCAVNPTGCYQDNQWRDIAVYFRPSPRSGVKNTTLPSHTSPSCQRHDNGPINVGTCFQTIICPGAYLLHAAALADATHGIGMWQFQHH